MRTILAGLLAIGLSAHSIANAASPGPPVIEVGPDQLAIYEVVLGPWLEPNRGRQAVNERLAPRPSPLENRECVERARFSRTADAAGDEARLPRDAFAGQAIDLVDGERWQATDPEALIARGAPVDSAVREGFSRSLFTLSQVTFSRDRKDALVSFSDVCGRLCGAGATLWMHKSRGGWQVAARCSSVQY